jgi:hypothetical protein
VTRGAHERAVEDLRACGAESDARDGSLDRALEASAKLPARSNLRDARASEDGRARAEVAKLRGTTTRWW